MKASKIVTLVLSFLLFAGIVGSAAVLSKNFTEIPEFILDSSETIVKHKEDTSTNSNKQEEPITDSDINHIVYRECECYTSSTNYSFGSRRELTQSKTDPGIFYAEIPTGDSIGKSGFWGIKAGFVLDSGKIKSWTYDLDGSKAKHPFNSNNPGLFTLICMSFFGDEPDLGIFSDIFSNYVLTETIESNFDFKIYVFESSVAQLDIERITITGENDDHGYSSEQRYNRYSEVSEGSFVFSQLNFSSLDLSVTIKQIFSDGNELNYSWELSPHNVSGLSSLVILYSPNTIAVSDQYDEYFGYETLIDSQTEITIGYLYFYGISADYIEGTSLESVECPGLYKISLSRDDFLHLSDQTGNLLVIDNDPNASRDNDVQFFLRKISTVIDGSAYDEWDDGGSSETIANSLEIHQDGTELETQVTGKNDGPLGDWYIDGHITPPEVNYILEITIEIKKIGSQSYYTSNFLNHASFIGVSGDLRNTKWVLNSSLNSDSGVFTYNINFISNNTNYTTVEINGTQGVILKYGSINVYTELNSWSNQSYRIIEITGGTDVTNSALIQWLEANATQVPVVDLTNTTWLINSITCPAGYGIFTLNYDNYQHEYDSWIEDTNTQLGIGYYWTPQIDDWRSQANRVGTLSSLTDVEINDKLRFNSGTDIANPDLIAWLEENATYEGTFTPEPSYSYTVSFVSQYGESKTNYKSYFRIYDGQDNTGTLLFESVGHIAITFPISVTCTTGYLYVEMEGSMVSYCTTASSGITPTNVYSDLSANWDTVYTITNDGTITIDDLDYDD